MTDLPEIGDHLVSARILYTHHALFVGDDHVIHYAGNGIPGVCGPVEEIPLDQFANGAGYTVRAYDSRTYTRSESVIRAKARLGEDSYCVFANNCEHFVEWCITGTHDSSQVNNGASVATGAATAIGGGAGIGVVSAAGSVAGLSGSGIMSGLASIGSVVGGGAVVGLAALSAVPGALTAYMMCNTLLKDNEALETEERDARAAGRVGTSVGAVTATVSGVVAVSTMGATAGLSAAGISSGLAAIGASSGLASVLAGIGIGGGAMAAGVAVTVAAPAMIAAVFGYGIYQTMRSLNGASCSPVIEAPIILPPEN